MCRVFCGTIIARLARFHIAVCRKLPQTQKTLPTIRSEGAKSATSAISTAFHPHNPKSRLDEQWRCGNRNKRSLCCNRAMPTVLRSGPYRFYFYSHEPNEPPHVHVDRDDVSAKFWLDPVQLAANFGFRAHELREIQSIVLENRVRLLEAWHDFFGSSGG
ncbi:MAG: DUF4160 domain-containing protein [Candidatus Sulfotelmatobacter sp.]